MKVMKVVEGHRARVDGTHSMSSLTWKMVAWCSLMRLPSTSRSELQSFLLLFFLEDKRCHERHLPLESLELCSWQISKTIQSLGPIRDQMGDYSKAGHAPDKLGHFDSNWNEPLLSFTENAFLRILSFFNSNSSSTCVTATTCNASRNEIKSQPSWTKPSLKDSSLECLEPLVKTKCNPGFLWSPAKEGDRVLKILTTNEINTSDFMKNMKLAPYNPLHPPTLSCEFGNRSVGVL